MIAMTRSTDVSAKESMTSDTEKKGHSAEGFAIEPGMPTTHGYTVLSRSGGCHSIPYHTPTSMIRRHFDSEHCSRAGEARRPGPPCLAALFDSQ